METTVEAVILYALLVIISLVLLILSVLSYWKYEKRRTLFISMILCFFFIRSVLLSLGLFYEPIATFTSSVYIWGFDLVILLLFYIMSLKK